MLPVFAGRCVVWICIALMVSLLPLGVPTHDAMEDVDVDHDRKCGR